MENKDSAGEWVKEFRRTKKKQAKISALQAKNRVGAKPYQGINIEIRGVSLYASLLTRRALMPTALFKDLILRRARESKHIYLRFYMLEEYYPNEDYTELRQEILNCYDKLGDITIAFKADNIPEAQRIAIDVESVVRHVENLISEETHRHLKKLI